MRCAKWRTTCGSAAGLSLQRKPDHWFGPADTPVSDENTVVDVLVVWTPQREEETAVETVRAVIDLGIAYTNDAFERSGAFVSLNLVGAERIGYDESGNASMDLARLVDPSDGHMDAVHGRRDALGADLVSLAIARGGPGLSGGYGSANAPGAFSVSSGQSECRCTRVRSQLRPLARTAPEAGSWSRAWLCHVESTLHIDHHGLWRCMPACGQAWFRRQRPAFLFAGALSPHQRCSARRV